MALLPGAGGALAMPAAGSGGGSRPASGAGAGTSAAGGQPSPEDLMRRLLETQRMLVAFSRENDRLASENGRLRTGKTLVANDYKGRWLRTRVWWMGPPVLRPTVRRCACMLRRPPPTMQSRLPHSFGAAAPAS